MASDVVGLAVSGDTGLTVGEASGSISRLYRCGVCGLTAPDFEDLRSHMLSEHLPATDQSQQIPDGQCQIRKSHSLEKYM